MQSSFPSTDGASQVRCSPENHTLGVMTFDQFLPYLHEAVRLGVKEYDKSQLMCSNSRIVSARGVHVCPILVDQPDSLLGQRLSGAKQVFELRYPACMTCYQY